MDADGCWLAQDILFAMMTLGFENYSDALKIYLTKYREVSTALRRAGRSCSSIQRGC